VRGERGYVITGNDEFLLPYVLSRPVLEDKISQLKVLTSTVGDQRIHVNSIAFDLQRFMAWQAKVIALQRSGQHDAAVTMIATGDGRRAVESILDELQHVEEHSEESLTLYAESAANYTRSNEIYQYGLTLFGFLLLLISITAATAMRRSAEAEAEAREELRRRAMTDDLTGLANRRELLASLERAIAAARRNRRPLALALLDIDHFKRVNDLHGHPAGDAVIRRIALLAVDVMRGQDTVGRLSGEEFAIVLPDCSAEDAMAACERLCEEVRTTDLEMETGANLFITLSTGVTVFERNDSAESMIARADAALYAAKHGGRNQVKLAA
jgi:diguanylate cyclase (GGDEF)-like protein